MSKPVNKPRINLRQIFLAAIVLNLILMVIGVIYAANTYNKIVVKPNKPKVTKVGLDSLPTPTPDPDRPYSVLLMGYGGGKHDGGRLTDSMMVARVEPKLNKVTLISIPRDLWVPIPINGDETKNYKINAAYAIGSDDRLYRNKKEEFTGKAGGGELAKTVVSKVVGFPVDYFVALDFQGFIKTIDVLGGIDVEVQRTFDDFMYPIEKDVIDNCGFTDEEVAALSATMSGIKLEAMFPCRYEQLHFDKGTSHMEGELALKYARSRHSAQDGGDFNRAARQRQVIKAVREKVISLNFIPKAIPFIQTLASHLQTDIDLAKMEEFVTKSPQLTQYEIGSIALTDKNVLINGTSSDGQFVLMPKEGEDQWDLVHRFVLDPTILDPTPTVTRTPTLSSKSKPTSTIKPGL